MQRHFPFKVAKTTHKLRNYAPVDINNSHSLLCYGQEQANLLSTWRWLCDYLFEYIKNRKWELLYISNRGMYPQWETQKNIINQTWMRIAWTIQSHFCRHNFLYVLYFFSKYLAFYLRNRFKHFFPRKPS